MNEICWYFVSYEDSDKYKCMKNKPKQWCDENCPLFKSLDSAFRKSRLSEKYWSPFKLNKPPQDVQAIEILDKIRNDITTFVDTGSNLLIQSKMCGNGKTSWGIKLLQKQIEHRHLQSSSTVPPAYYIYLPDLLLKARDNITNSKSGWENMKYCLLNSPLVMFDDLGCITLKDYDLLVLSSIIENRINSGLSSIFTSNLIGDSLKQNIGDRLYDRVTKLSTVIEFRANSMRKTV